MRLLGTLLISTLIFSEAVFADAEIESEAEVFQSIDSIGSMFLEVSGRFADKEHKGLGIEFIEPDAEQRSKCREKNTDFQAKLVALQQALDTINKRLKSLKGYKAHHAALFEVSKKLDSTVSIDEAALKHAVARYRAVISATNSSAIGDSIDAAVLADVESFLLDAESVLEDEQ